MDRAGWLRLGNHLARPGDAWWRLTIGVALLGERLLGPALVYVATKGGAERAFAFGVLLTALMGIRSTIQSRHATRTEARLYVRVVDSVLRQDVLRSSILPEDEALVALFEGARAVAALIGEVLPALCANAVAAAAFALVVAFAEPFPIVAVAFLAGAAGTTLLFALRATLRSAQTVESSAWIALAEGVGQAFEGRLEIAAGGRTDAYVDRFERVASEWKAATVRASHVARLAGRAPILGFAMLVGTSVVLYGLARGEPTGQMLARGAFLASLSPAFVGLAQALQDVARSNRRVRDFTDMIRTDLPAWRGGPAATEASCIEVRGVHFWYETGGVRHEALRGVSFTWRAGELLALAGPNGSGKSTCLRALLGLGTISGGAVLVDGIPLDRLDIESWRRRIAFVSQRSYLPPRSTIRDCLRFVDRDVDDEAMVAALARVGMATAGRSARGSILDLRADDLSVGQKRRVALARSLCRRVRIYLFDEPDANLDPGGVALVSGLLRELAGSGMVLFAAHSPDLLAVADRTIHLEEGRLATRPSVLRASH